MAEKWCHNAKTGEIFSYNVEGDLTDFPRGDLMAYGDYLTTGIKSREEAEEWAKTNLPCEKCKSSRTADDDGNCRFCGSKLQTPEAHRETVDR